MIRRFTNSKLQAIAALATLLLSPLFKRHLYELFLHLHQVATIALVVALWIHTKTEETQSRALLLAGTVLYITLWLLQIVRALYINIGINWRTGCSSLRWNHITLFRYEGGVWILPIHLARTRSIRPGKYVFLTFCVWRHVSLLQRHPYMVVWQDDLPEESVVYILLEGHKGWTKALIKGLLGDFVRKMAKEESEKHVIEGINVNEAKVDKSVKKVDIDVGKLRVWFNGSYGRTFDSGSHDLCNHDNVLLLAEGTGILAHLPLMKRLVDRSKSTIVRTDRVKLVWDTRGIYPVQIGSWLNQLLGDKDLHRDVRIAPYRYDMMYCSLI